MTDVKRINAVKGLRPVRVIDLVVIGVTLALALSLSLFSVLKKERGVAVSISVDGVETEYSLDKDVTLTIRSLTIEIKDGGVCVVKSGCPDGICKATGRITAAGQTIACVPEGVVIRIVGESSFQVDTGEGL